MLNKQSLPGYSDILKLAIPIYGGLLANTLVGIADTAFLGHVDVLAQSAAGYGSLLHLVFYVIGYGFTLGPQILIARKRGEGLPELAGNYMYHAWAVMIWYGLFLVGFTYWIVPELFEHILQSTEIAQATTTYLQARSFGFPFTMINLCFMAYFVGIGRSTAVGVASITGGIFNVALNSALIFGVQDWIAPMGLKGAAIASGCSEIISFLIYVLFLSLQADKKGFGLTRSAMQWSKSLYASIFKVSTPLIIQNLISIVAWFVFFTLIEKTGEENFGISIIIRSIYAVFMISAIALGSAGNTMVSNLMGSKSYELIFPLLRRIIIISGVFMIISNCILGIFPETIFGLFTQSESLISGAKPTLVVLLLALFLFGVSNILFQSVSGTGKTTITLIIEVISIFIYLGFSAWSVWYYPSQLPVIWSAEIVYMGMMGLFSYLYLRTKHWIPKDATL